MLAITTPISQYTNTLSSLCLGTNNKPGFCNSLDDDIRLARKNGAKIISISITKGEYPLDYSDPTIRAEIAAAVADGTIVVIAAGNAFEHNINKIQINNSTYLTPDNGSIIVGGVSLTSQLYRDSAKYYNYGLSLSSGLFTSLDQKDGGHGTDVSAPADSVWAASYFDPNKVDLYEQFPGTSSATPIIAGVASLILAAKPDLSPLEIRRTLRETRQDSLLPPENSFGGSKPIAGMVDAYKAVSRYVPTQYTFEPGLVGKIYSNSLYLPPEDRIGAITNGNDDNGNGLENIPFKSGIFHGINFSSYQYSHAPYYNSQTKEFHMEGLNDNYYNDNSNSNFFPIDELQTGETAFNTFFGATFEGMINIINSGSYQFFLKHDDRAKLFIDGNPVIDDSSVLNPLNNGLSDAVNSSGFINLTAGYHSIKVEYSQVLGDYTLKLGWIPPQINASFTAKAVPVPYLNATNVPPEILFHNKELENVNQYSYSSGLIGRFFNGIITNTGSETLENTPRYPDISRVVRKLNDSSFSESLNLFNDSGNSLSTQEFSSIMTGYLKIPNYVCGRDYNLVLGHDGDAEIYFNKNKILSSNGLDYREETSAPISSNIGYNQIVIKYNHYNGYDSKLNLKLQYKDCETGETVYLSNMSDFYH